MKDKARALAETATQVTDAVSPGVSSKLDQGRMARKRRATKAKLLIAANELLATIAENSTGPVSLEATKVKDITDRADVGLGTFYTHFDSQEAFAVKYLDCLVNSYGQRLLATAGELRETDPPLFVSFSLRLLICEAAQTPEWRWWVKRPELVANCFRKGLKPFLYPALQRTIYNSMPEATDDLTDTAWMLATWMLIGSIHALIVDGRPFSHEAELVVPILRVLHIEQHEAVRLAGFDLPAYDNNLEVDWAFDLEA